MVQCPGLRPTVPQLASGQIPHPTRCLQLSIKLPILEPSVVGKILTHVGEPTEPPAVLPARAPPQMNLDFDQVDEENDWPDMDQTAETGDETWN